MNDFPGFDICIKTYRTEQNRTDLIQKNYLELIKRHIEFSPILFSQFMIRSEQIKYCDC